MKVVIVDDEPSALEQISRVVKTTLPYIEIIGTAANPEAAKNVILSTKPDLVFLDIQMDSGTTSIPFVAKLILELGIDFKIVFVSGYGNDRPAQKIRVAAIDLLEKPIDPAKLKVAVHNAFRVDASARQKMVKWISGGDDSTIPIRDVEGISESLKKADIVKIKTVPKVSKIDAEKKNIPENPTAKLSFELIDGTCRFINLQDGVSIKDYEQELEADWFASPAAKMLVNLAYVKSFVSRKYVFIQTDGERVEGTRRHWAAFKARKKEYDDFNRTSPKHWTEKLKDFWAKLIQ